MTDYQTNSDGTVTITGHTLRYGPPIATHFLVGDRFACGEAAGEGRVGVDEAGVFLALVRAPASPCGSYVCGECAGRAGVSIVRRVQHLEALVDRLLLGMHGHYATLGPHDPVSLSVDGVVVHTVVPPGRPFPKGETP